MIIHSGDVKVEEGLGDARTHNARTRRHTGAHNHTITTRTGSTIPSQYTQQLYSVSVNHSPNPNPTNSGVARICCEEWQSC